MLCNGVAVCIMTHHLGQWCFTSRSFSLESTADSKPNGLRKIQTRISSQIPRDSSSSDAHLGLFAVLQLNKNKSQNQNAPRPKEKKWLLTQW